MSQLATSLDLRFPHDVIRHGDILRSHVGPEASLQTPKKNDNWSNNLLVSLIEEEYSARSMPSDEINRYIRSTANGDITIDTLVWWKSHEKLFPNVESLAHDLLAVKASSVASESCF